MRWTMCLDFKTVSFLSVPQINFVNFCQVEQITIISVSHSKNPTQTALVAHDGCEEHWWPEKHYTSSSVILKCWGEECFLLCTCCGCRLQLLVHHIYRMDTHPHSLLRVLDSVIPAWCTQIMNYFCLRASLSWHFTCLGTQHTTLMPKLVENVSKSDPSTTTLPDGEGMQSSFPNFYYFHPLLVLYLEFRLGMRESFLNTWRGVEFALKFSGGFQ